MGAFGAALTILAVKAAQMKCPAVRFDLALLRSDLPTWGDECENPDEDEVVEDHHDVGHADVVDVVHLQPETSSWQVVALKRWRYAPPFSIKNT